MKEKELETDAGQHLATFSKSTTVILDDDSAYYVYARVARRTADRTSRLELLSKRLKELNERNAALWQRKV